MRYEAMTLDEIENETDLSDNELAKALMGSYSGRIAELERELAGSETYCESLEDAKAELDEEVHQQDIEIRELKEELCDLQTKLEETEMKLEEYE